MTLWFSFLIFIIPGILLLSLPFTSKIEFVDLIIYIIGLSISFWICIFWFLKFIPLSLTSLFLLTSIISGILTSYLLIKRGVPYTVSFNTNRYFLILVFIFVLGLRLAPLRYAIAPAGADMSMHTYITNLIVHANGMPKNYHPILEIDKFDSFPVGFHTVSSLLSLVGKISGYRSVFIMTALTYLFLTMFLFVFLKNYASWPYALATSISFTFLTQNPQEFVSWGGTPTIFALALFILFMSLLDRLHSNSFWLSLLSSISLAAVFLSHIIIFVQSFYIFGFSFLIYLFLIKKQNRSIVWTAYAQIALLFFIIIIPYLVSLNRDILTPETLDWIRNWVRNTDHVWHGSINDFLWTIPLYIKKQVFGSSFFSYSLIIATTGLAFLYKKRHRKRGIQYATSMILCILLILNTRYWFLLFSYAIYPERVAIMIIIPLSVFFACALQNIISLVMEQKRLGKFIVCLLLIELALFALIFNREKYVNPLIQASSVTEDDLKAFSWLKGHTAETDIIQNNYGDAGLWIPSIIERKITNPHLNVLYLDKVEKPEKATYIYIGKKCVYECPLQSPDLDKKQYKNIYSVNGVNIYKVQQ